MGIVTKILIIWFFFSFTFGLALCVNVLIDMAYYEIDLFRFFENTLFTKLNLLGKILYLLLILPILIPIFIIDIISKGFFKLIYWHPLGRKGKSNTSENEIVLPKEKNKGGFR